MWAGRNTRLLAPLNGSSEPSGKPATATDSGLRPDRLRRLGQHVRSFSTVVELVAKPPSHPGDLVRKDNDDRHRSERIRIGHKVTKGNPYR